MKNITKVNEVATDDVKMLRFRLNNGWDYIWVTYHDQKGFISITSSFGNYSYIWSSMGKGVTLREFFLRANCDYLAEKLYHESRNELHYFSFSSAIQDIKKAVAAEVKAKSITRSEAKVILEELKDWSDEADSEMSQETFLRDFFAYEALSTFDCEPWHSNYGLKVKGTFLTLRDEIVPLIKDHFSNELKKGYTSEVA